MSDEEGTQLAEGWWMRQTILEEPGAIVTTLRIGQMMASTHVNEGTDLEALKAQAIEVERLGPGYHRVRDGAMTDAEMEGWHNQTIARVKSGAIVIPRANRLTVYDLGALIKARAREMLREMSPDEIEKYHLDEDEGDVLPGEGDWEWQPLLDEIYDRVKDEFDVQDPDDPETDGLRALHDLVYDAVGTWVNEQEARAQGLPPPVMTALEEETFWRELIRDELKKRTPGTKAGEVMPIVEERMERLRALRRREEGR